MDLHKGHSLICVKILIAGLALSSCGSVYRTSALTEYTQTGNPSFCTSSTGGYSLPVGKLAFVVEKKVLDQNSGRFRFELTGSQGRTDDPGVKIHPDARHTYCLDFLRSVTSADAIRVEREKGLLKSVYSNVEDKSDEAILELAEGVGTAIAASTNPTGRSFAEADGSLSTKQMDFEFDPFDARLLTQVNAALKPTGHCVYIDPEGDPLVPFWMANQCSDTKTYKPYSSKTSPEEAFDYSEYEAGEGRFGLLYRPSVTHTLVVLKRDDPDLGGPWRVWKRMTVSMPNRAPIFLLQVKRGLFTARKTKITFNEGALESVEVDKKSELNAAADLVVGLVQIAVQIPAKALIISTKEAENRQKIIETNIALIDLYAKVKADGEKVQAKFDALTDEQKNEVIKGGASPRSTGRATISHAACLENAATVSIEEAEELCGEAQDAQ